MNDWKRILNRKVMYDAVTDMGNSGGAVTTPDTPDVPDVPDTPDLETPVDPVTPTDPTEAVEEKKEFNPEELDFDTDEEIESIDTTPFSNFCKEFNIDPNDKTLKENIAFMNEIGMTQEQQEKLMRTAQEKNAKKEINPAEVKKDMRANLTPQELADYTPIANAFKTIFKDTPELYDLAKQDILTDPTIMKVLSMFKRHIEGKKGASLNPTPATKNAHVGTLSYEQGVKKYNDTVAEMLRKGEKVTSKAKQSVLDKISQEVKNSDLNNFKNYLK